MHASFNLIMGPLSFPYADETRHRSPSRLDGSVKGKICILLGWIYLIIPARKGVNWYIKMYQKIENIINKRLPDAVSGHIWLVSIINHELW